MPKLYYSPISCGAASFIAMVGAGLQFEVEQVYLDCHRTASDADFYTINPKGNVPCLVLDDGTILNENVAVLQYIADQVGACAKTAELPITINLIHPRRTPTVSLLSMVLLTDTCS